MKKFLFKRIFYFVLVSNIVLSLCACNSSSIQASTASNPAETSSFSADVSSTEKTSSTNISINPQEESSNATETSSKEASSKTTTSAKATASKSQSATSQATTSKAAVVTTFEEGKQQLKEAAEEYMEEHNIDPSTAGETGETCPHCGKKIWNPDKYGFGNPGYPDNYENSGYCNGWCAVQVG